MKRGLTQELFLPVSALFFVNKGFFPPTSKITKEYTHGGHAMNAEQLKNSILQRAVEGKLVEQREEEGTAA